MKIRNGMIPFKNNAKNENSIIDIIINDEFTISVYKGNRGINPKHDIRILYYQVGKRSVGRTPRHIHWAVDLLLKRKNDAKLTKNLIQVFQKEWDNCKPLQDREPETLTHILEDGIERININKYKKLNSVGEYDVEFIIVLMLLLMNQEKTSAKEPRMFKEILDDLLVDDENLDIFAIMSTAGFGGRY